MKVLRSLRRSVLYCNVLFFLSFLYVFHSLSIKASKCSFLPFPSLMNTGGFSPSILYMYPEADVSCRTFRRISSASSSRRTVPSSAVAKAHKACKKHEENTTAVMRDDIFSPEWKSISYLFIFYRFHSVLLLLFLLNTVRNVRGNPCVADGAPAERIYTERPTPLPDGSPSLDSLTALSLENARATRYPTTREFVFGGWPNARFPEKKKKGIKRFRASYNTKRK